MLFLVISPLHLWKRMWDSSFGGSLMTEAVPPLRATFWTSQFKGNLDQYQRNGNGPENVISGERLVVSV